MGPRVPGGAALRRLVGAVCAGVVGIRASEAARTHSQAFFQLSLRLPRRMAAVYPNTLFMRRTGGARAADHLRARQHGGESVGCDLASRRLRPRVSPERALEPA